MVAADHISISTIKGVGRICERLPVLRYRKLKDVACRGGEALYRFNLLLYGQLVARFIMVVKYSRRTVRAIRNTSFAVRC